MRFFLTMLFFLITTILFSQQNFPETDPSLLLNKKVKVLPRDPRLQKFGYDGFYKNDKMKQKYACCESFNSKYESLANKEFTVLSSEPYANILGDTLYKLKIHNDEIGDLFFSYDPRFEYSFPFEVIGGLTFPEGYFCRQIIEKTDKFTNEKSIWSPMFQGIVFFKTIKNGTHYYMQLRLDGSTLSTNKKGLILLLSDNKRIERPEADVDVGVSKVSGYYSYSTIIELNDDERKLLTENDITDARLYIYDANYKDGSYKLKEYAKCVLQ